MPAIRDADAPHPLALAEPQAAGDALELAGAVEQQEVGEGEHDDRLDEVVEQPDRDLLDRVRGVAEVRRQLRRLLGEQLGDVVLVVELAELLVVVRPALEVVDVGGQLRAELLDLADDRRDHVQDEEAEADEEDDVDDEDREPARQRAAADPRPLDQVDQRAQREREEDGGEQPADRRPHLDDDVLEQQRDADRDQHDRDHLEHGPGLDARGVHAIPTVGFPRGAQNRALLCAHG